MLKLADTVKNTTIFQAKLSQVLIDTLRKRVQTKGLNVRLRIFKAYEPSYKKLKQGRKIKGAVSARVSPPNMTLSGQMMNALKVYKVTAKYFIFGWKGKAADKIRFLHDERRSDFPDKNYEVVNLGAGEPLSKFENKLIRHAYENDFNKKLKKYEREKIVFKI